MSLDLKLDGNHDLALAAGDAVLTDGANRVRQGIDIALRIWLGEYFLDSDVGVPYLETIIVKSPSLPSIEAALRAVIRSVDGVQSVDSLTAMIDRRARSLSVSFTATSSYGLIADTILISE
jgi:hypothetical protein